MSPEPTTDPMAPVFSLTRAWAEEELVNLVTKGLRQTLEPLSSSQGPEVVVSGERLVNFSSNDYLGLAADERLIEAASNALSTYGLGTGASRLVTGDTELHQRLESALAQWFGAEAALVFNTGYACNVGVLQALVGAEDVVFSDALNHASIVDGCRLSRAQVVVYPHADVDALATLMTQHRGRRRLVVTDAVFSMDGDRAPIVRLLELCRREEAALMVDEAHALGVLGERGTGLCEALKVGAAVDVRVGTFGKALGGQGAFVVTSKAVRDLLLSRARSLVHSTALPAAWCAAAEVAIERTWYEPERRARLWRNIEQFAEGLRRFGVMAEPGSPIFSVVLGSPDAAVEASAALRRHGLLVKPIRPPTVPEGTSRLRFSLSAAHTPEHVVRALRALQDCVFASESRPDAPSRGWQGLHATAGEQGDDAPDWPTLPGVRNPIRPGK